MAATFNLTGDRRIEQGADYSYTVTLTDGSAAPINLTGCTLASQIRVNHDGDLMGAFTATISVPTSGIAVLSMPAATTARLPATSGNRYWKHDVLLTRADGSKLRILEGDVEVDDSITHD